MNKSTKMLVVAAICLLAIGFAAVSTTLSIKGDISVGTNGSNFNIVFINRTIETGTSAGADATANAEATAAIESDGKELNISTQTLKAVGDYTEVSYTIENQSDQYDAVLSIGTIVDNVITVDAYDATSNPDADQTYNDYYDIVVTPDWYTVPTQTQGPVAALGKVTGKVRITLKKVYDDPENTNAKITPQFKITLNANAIERTEVATTVAG